jgi:hypothetical protein
MGGTGINTLFGGSGINTLFGGSGINTAVGGTGINTLFGGSGINAAVGGAGINTLFGGSGINTLFGGSGINTLVGGSGINTLFGGSGINTLFGGSGINTLFGGSGINTLLGGSGINTLLGGSGINTLLGGSGINTLLGGSGMRAQLSSDGITTLLNSSGFASLLNSSGFASLVHSSGFASLLHNSNFVSLVNSSGFASLVNSTGLATLLASSGLGTSPAAATADVLLGVVVVDVAVAVALDALISATVVGPATAAVVGPAASTAAVVGPVASTAAVVGPVASTAAVVGPAASTTAVVGPVASTAAIPTIQSALLNIPEVQALVLSTQAGFEAVMTDPSLEAQANTNPVSLATLLNNQTIQAQLASPAEQTFIQQQVQASNPLILQAELATNPTNLSSPVVQAIVQKFITAAESGQMAMSVNLTGSGNEVVVGLASDFSLGSNSLARESLTPAQVAIVNQAVADGITDLTPFMATVTATGGNNTFVGGVGANFTASNGGTNNFVVEDPSLMGLAGTSVPNQLGGYFNGGGARDTYSFTGGAAANFGNITLTEPTGAAQDDVLDFSNFQGQGPQGQGISLNLNKLNAQPVASGFNLTVPGTITNVIGSPYADTITGNNLSDTISGAALDNPDPYAKPAQAPATPKTQLVYLDFADFATPPMQEFVINFQTPGYQPALIANTTGLQGSNPSIEVAVPVTGGAGINALQALSFGSAVNGGTFTLTYNGKTTGPINWDPNPTNLAANIQAALDTTNATFVSANVTVTATPISESLHNDGTDAPGTYTAADQQAILTRLQSIYSAFTVAGAYTSNLVQFTLTKPTTTSNYETVYFNDTPIDNNGQPFWAGQSNEIDFRNQNQTTSMEVNVNALLGVGVGQLPDTDANWINMTSEVTAHELGHTLGLRHEDALGPIGFGISNPPGPNAYYPAYPGSVGAFTTTQHIMASPAAVGTTLLDIANPNDYFGEREAITLAFINGGTVVAGTRNDGTATVIAPTATGDTIGLVNENPATNGTVVADGSQTVAAQAVNLYSLNVPNPIPAGNYDSGKTYDVNAVDVLGHLNATAGGSAGAGANFYTFSGLAGDLMNFDVKSFGTIDPNIIDSVVYVYGPDGKLVAWNDDQFEGPDSSIVDLTLPSTGKYTVEVDSYHDAVGQASAAGDYQLFMYRTVNYNATSGNDTLIGGSGSQKLIGGTGNTSFVMGTNSTGSFTVLGGNGQNTLVNTSNTGATFNVTGPNAGSFSINGSGSFSGVQSLTGGTANDTFKFSTGGSLAGTIDGGGGTNTLDYSNYVGPVTVDLPLHAASLVHGATGNFATSPGNSIANIQNVTGSQGTDIIVGDNNPNVLAMAPTNPGRSLLISGTGADKLIGGGPDDILVAGTTEGTTADYEQNLPALNAVMTEWTSSDSFKNRVNAVLNTSQANLNMLNGVPIVLYPNSNKPSTGTIVDNPTADTIVGGTGPGLDLIYYDVSLTTLSNVLTGDKLVNIQGARATNLSAADGAIAYTPAQIRTAYGVNNLAYDGSGQTIAVVEAYDNPKIFDAVDAFDTQFGLTTSGSSLYDQYGPAASFLTVLGQTGQISAPLPATDPTGGWEVEEALDVEWAHAMAPGAQIVVVEANSQSLSDLMASVATAAGQPGVSVVSMSWGFTEGQAVLAQDEALYDGDLTTPAGHTPVTFVASTGDYGTNDPEYPSFSPNVVAVGGTSLFLNADNSYKNESGWGYFSSQFNAFVGSGGGASLYEPQPGYQAGVQSTGFRTTPDVSLVADPGTGAWIADPYNLSAANPWEVVGGTSLSAPAWAGLMALVDQGRVAAGKTNLSSDGGTTIQAALYSAPSNAFNSITSGTNGGYTAVAGYNLVIGLGTPVANLLVPVLVAYNGTSAPNATATGNGSGADGSGSSNVLNGLFPVVNALIVSSPLLGRGPDLGHGVDSATATLAAPPVLSITHASVPAASGYVAFATHTAAPAAGSGSELSVSLVPSTVAAVASPATLPIAAPSRGYLLEVIAAQPQGAAGNLAALDSMFSTTQQGSLGGELLLGGEGDDMLVGGDGGDFLISGFGQNGPVNAQGSNAAGEHRAADEHPAAAAFAERAADSEDLRADYLGAFAELGMSDEPAVAVGVDWLTGGDMDNPPSMDGPAFEDGGDQ